MIKIGILGLQGAFAEHCKLLSQIKDVEVELITKADQIETLDGLVLPGGESTAIGLLAKGEMVDALKRWIHRDHPTWGTCAGMIMMCNKGEHLMNGQALLGGVDCVVSRNYFGRQLNSFEMKLNANVLSDPSAPFVGLFIRAPAILEAGPNVKVLNTIQSHVEEGKQVIVAAQQSNLLCTAFHPELTDDARWHEYFVSIVTDAKNKAN